MNAVLEVKFLLEEENLCQVEPLLPPQSWIIYDGFQ